MPAGHRKVAVPAIRREDVPGLAAYATGAILTLFVVWIATALLRIPVLKGMVLAIMCYLAILAGGWVKKVILGFLTTTENEGREGAEKMLRTETMIGVPLHPDHPTNPRLKVPGPVKGWPTEKDARQLEISDRGADQS
jgi:hypothetical protein